MHFILYPITNSKMHNLVFNINGLVTNRIYLTSFACSVNSADCDICNRCVNLCIFKNTNYKRSKIVLKLFRQNILRTLPLINIIFNQTPQHFLGIIDIVVVSIKNDYCPHYSFAICWDFTCYSYCYSYFLLPVIKQHAKEQSQGKF